MWSDEDQIKLVLCRRRTAPPPNTLSMVFFLFDARAGRGYNPNLSMPKGEFLNSDLQREFRMAQKALRGRPEKRPDQWAAFHRLVGVLPLGLSPEQLRKMEENLHWDLRRNSNTLVVKTSAETEGNLLLLGVALEKNTVSVMMEQRRYTDTSGYCAICFLNFSPAGKIQSGSFTLRSGEGDGMITFVGEAGQVTSAVGDLFHGWQGRQADILGMIGAATFSYTTNVREALLGTPIIEK